MPYSVPSVLSIAGSDPSGGAGIQADIKTVEAMGLYAQAVICACTAQNTLGVAGVHAVPADFVRLQIDTVYSDIRPDAVKIGMVSNADIAHAVADALEAADASRIVVDPVMVSTSGSRLIDDGCKQVLVERLFPMASVITPNRPEAEALLGYAVRDDADAERAARDLSVLSNGSAVLVKGGHAADCADDVLFDGKDAVWLRQARIVNPNTHGTGCTLSSAIAVGLARGLMLEDAVKNAKDYITGALSASFDIGCGSGPLDHMWAFRG